MHLNATFDDLSHLAYDDGYKAMMEVLEENLIL